MAKLLFEYCLKLIDFFSRIKNKTCGITTDGATNYVKAFSTFGLDSIDNMPDSGEEDSIQEAPIDIVTILTEPGDGSEVWLPKNFRCAAHCLSLVAKKDAAKAERDQHYKKLSRGFFGQVQGLWNFQARSNQKSDDILELIGSKFIIPNETRWNSHFDALVDIQKKIDKNPEGMWKVLERMPGLRRFRDVELEFLKEYITVMTPIAQGLDKLQGDQDMSLGYLLPTITSIKKKLNRISSNLRHCQPLLDSILTGLSTRFDHLYDDDDFLLATVTVPMFKTMWTEDAEIKSRSARLLKQAEQRIVSSEEEEEVEMPLVGRQNSFFEIAQEEEEQDGEAVQYLRSKDTNLKSLKKWPKIEKVFRKYNTPLPSSASVERLFSRGSLVFQTKRHKLLDSNFEIHVFMKSNAALF